VARQKNIKSIRKTTKTARRKTQRTGALRPIHIHISVGVIILLSALVAWVIGVRQSLTTYAGPPSAPTGKIWNLTWSDEFSGSSIDTAKWNVQNNSNYGGGNNEDQCYMANNVSVASGSLRLTAQRQTVSCGATNPDTGNSTYYYTSGMVTTRAQQGSMKYKFKQGYAEARIKAPKGNPYWPAFWLVSPNDGSTPGWPDYGEFDITELYGARPDSTTGSMHYKCTDGDGHCQLAPGIYNIKVDSAYGGNSNLGTQVSSTQNPTYTGPTHEFQVYGFLWEADKLTWYVNGRKVRYFDGTSLYRIEQNGSQTLENTTATLGQPAIPFSTVFAYDHSINLNLAVGGNGPRYSTYGYTGIDTAGGYSDGNLVADNPGILEIDYVRIYQLATAPTPSPSPTPTPTPSPTPSPSPSTPTNSGTSTPSPSGGTAATVVPETGAIVSGGAALTPGLDTDPELQAKVEKVEYYIDGKLMITLTEPPYKFDTTTLRNGTYVLGEKIYYKDGTVSSKDAPITVVHSTPTTKNVAFYRKPVVIGTAAIIGTTLAALFALPSTRSMLLHPVNALRNRQASRLWRN
jgi:beta-glucanase (GH16 family)